MLEYTWYSHAMSHSHSAILLVSFRDQHKGDAHGHLTGETWWALAADPSSPLMPAAHKANNGTFAEKWYA